MLILSPMYHGTDFLPKYHIPCPFLTLMKFKKIILVFDKMVLYLYYSEICLVVIRIQEGNSQFYIIQFFGSHSGVLQTTDGRIWKNIPS